MLKVWSEAFHIRGTGIDRIPSFIEAGTQRLTNNRVKLICGDALSYTDAEKYDVVVCTELSAGLFNDFSSGIAFLEQYVKPGGTLVFGRLYAKMPNPPQELVEFNGELPTLREIYEEVKRCGHLITAMASDTTESWERYIMRDAKQALAKLRQNPQDEKWAAWTDKWFRMYFDYRRAYESWALFAIERMA